MCESTFPLVTSIAGRSLVKSASCVLLLTSSLPSGRYGVSLSVSCFFPSLGEAHGKAIGEYIHPADMLEARAVVASRACEVDLPRKSISETNFLYRSLPLS